MMEYIDGFDSRQAVLLAPKYQIDPLVEMLRHVIAFQRESVYTNKFARVLLRPRWKNNIAELNTALLRAYRENVTREIAQRTDVPRSKRHLPKSK